MFKQIKPFNYLKLLKKKYNNKMQNIIKTLSLAYKEKKTGI